ncbi:MAG: hypothetical protein L6R39_006467 [Caloplaca ligustica]|nr:MAG: hypothetical protein L6R39_006467 [Caloplaca ligustica]
MAAPHWPHSPNLCGRPIDTALLLHRDYVADFCNRIYKSRACGVDDSIPSDAFLPLLQSMTSIGNALAMRVDGLKNGFDTFAKIQQSIDLLNGQHVRRHQQQPGQWLGPYRVERERVTSVEVKEELQSLSLSDADSRSFRPSPTRRSSSRSSTTQQVTTSRKVTIKIRDPEIRPELRGLTDYELADRFLQDLGDVKFEKHRHYGIRGGGDPDDSERTPLLQYPQYG